MLRWRIIMQSQFLRGGLTSDSLHPLFYPFFPFTLL